MRQAAPIAPMPNRQRGTVLIIALVFLLLMTLVGVAAMQGTTMQERMAGNHRDRNLAFQAAEAVLREGEAWLDSLTPAEIENLDSSPRLTNPQNWDGSNRKGILTDLDTQLAAGPVFHVGEPRVALLHPEDPQSSPIRELYPVTARAVGGTDTAVVILQSHCELPCRP